MSPPDAPRVRRAGFTLAEVLCTLLVVGICLTILVRLSFWHLRHGARLHRGAMALEHATNVLETLRGQPWEELARDVDRQESLPAELAHLLPDGTVHVQVTGGVEGFPRCRRLLVKVQWKEHGDLPAEVKLVAFRHPRRVETDSQETSLP